MTREEVPDPLCIPVELPRYHAVAVDESKIQPNT